MAAAKLKRSMGLEHRFLGMVSSGLLDLSRHSGKAGKALHAYIEKLDNAFDQLLLIPVLLPVALLARASAGIALAIEIRRMNIGWRVIEHNQRILDALSRPNRSGGG